MVVHLYYHHLWPEFAALIHNVPAPYALFVTIPRNSPAEAVVKADFPKADVRYVDNVGRDVAPFLALLPELQAYDVVCKVHTKRDTHIHREWRLANLHSLLGSRAMVERILVEFAARPDLMIVGARDLYVDGMLNQAANSELLQAFRYPLPPTFGFFAGTMFWIRPGAVADFPEIYPQEVFVPHQDLDGHPEHAIERLIGARIATRAGSVGLAELVEEAPQLEVSAAQAALTESWGAIVDRRLLPKYADYPANWYADATQARPRPVADLARLFAEHDGKVSDKWESYLATYDGLFSAYRERNLSVLEIGVQNGGTLEVLAKYFPNASAIVGNDIDPRCAKLQFDDPRVQVLVGDLQNPKVAEDVRRASRRYDIVIDDGSHRSGDVVRTFTQQFPRLADDGLYIVEDLHASYQREYGGGLKAPYSSVAFFKALVDLVNHQFWGTEGEPRSVIEKHLEVHGTKISNASLTHVHSVEFLNSMCIVRKKAPSQNVLGPRRISGQSALVEPKVVEYDGTSLSLEKGSSTGRSDRANRRPLRSRIASRLDRAVARLYGFLRRR